MVRDLGDYIVHSIDADKLVDWDLVEQVVSSIFLTPGFLVGSNHLCTFYN